MPDEGDQQCDIDHKVEGEDGADEKSEPATQWVTASQTLRHPLSNIILFLKLF